MWIVRILVMLTGFVVAALAVFIIHRYLRHVLQR